MDKNLMICTLDILLRIFLITLLVAACGSEANQPPNAASPSPGTENGLSGTPSNDNGLLNQNLDGSLYYYDRSKGSAVNFDIKTGTETVAIDTNWAVRIPETPAYVTAIPLEDQRGDVAVTFGPCAEIYDCVFIHDDNGSIDEHHLINSTPIAGVRLSRNGQYFATMVRDVNLDRFLQVYTRKGERVSSKRVDLNIYDFRWLPGGRIVYLDKVPGRVVFTLPYTAIPDKQWDLPENQKWALGTFDVSPDGNEIAFIIRRPHEEVENWYPDLYVLDLRSLTIRRIATVFDKRLEVNEPKSPGWSYDGQWIFVKDGGYQPGLASTEPPGTLFAIPAHMNRVLTISRIDSERSPEILKIFRWGITGKLPYSIWPRGEYYWRP